MANSIPDAISLYKICREYLMHEDSLINIRLNWLLVIQSLLFAAYGLLEKVIASGPSQDLIEDLVRFKTAIQILGFATSLLIFFSIFSGVLAIKKLEAFWNKKPKEISNDFPPLTGGGKFEENTCLYYLDQKQHSFQIVFGAPIIIPWIFIIVWIIMIFKL